MLISVAKIGVSILFLIALFSMWSEMESTFSLSNNRKYVVIQKINGVVTDVWLLKGG